MQNWYFFMFRKLIVSWSGGHEVFSRSLTEPLSHTHTPSCFFVADAHARLARAHSWSGWVSVCSGPPIFASRVTPLEQQRAGGSRRTRANGREAGRCRRRVPSARADSNNSRSFSATAAAAARVGSPLDWRRRSGDVASAMWEHHAACDVPAVRCTMRTARRHRYRAPPLYRVVSLSNALYCCRSPQDVKGTAMVCTPSGSASSVIVHGARTPPCSRSTSLVPPSAALLCFPSTAACTQVWAEIQRLSGRSSNPGGCCNRCTPRRSCCTAGWTPESTTAQPQDRWAGTLEGLWPVLSPSTVSPFSWLISVVARI